MADHGDRASQPLEYGLYVVATPIGNLGDMTFRAVEVLRGVDRIACEDTRVTGKLLNHFDIETPMTVYNDHTGHRARPGLVEALAEGGTLALVTDAGTPLLSDPGLKLVQDCIANDITVIPIPGASALLAGLVSAGLPTDRVLFCGFLPPRQIARRSALNEIKSVKATLIVYESGPRLSKCLTDLADVLGNRSGAVARELTKRFEEITRASLPALASTFAERAAPKGEMVIIVGPPAESEDASDTDIDAALHQALKTQSVRDAAATVSAALGQPRRTVYTRALDLASSETDDSSQ